MADSLLRFRCTCGCELKAPPTSVGKKARCPKCQQIVIVVAPGGDAPAPEAPPAADAPPAPPATDAASSPARPPSGRMPPATPPAPPGAAPARPPSGVSPPVPAPPGAAAPARPQSGVFPPPPPGPPDPAPAAAVRLDQARPASERRPSADALPAVVSSQDRPPEEELPPFEAAKRAFHQGADRKARQLLDELKVAEPANAQVRWLSAQLHERQMEVERAIEDYLAAADGGVAEAKAPAIELIRDSMLDLARQALAQGDHGRAFELASKILSRVSDLVEAELVGLEAAIELGRIDDAWPRVVELSAHATHGEAARRLKERILARDPGLEARLARAQLDAELSRLRVMMTSNAIGACGALAALASRYPGEATVLRQWGQALEAAGQPAQAMDAYRRSLELDPKHGKLVKRCLALMQEHASPEALHRWLDLMIEEGGHRHREMLIARLGLLERAGDPRQIGDLNELIELAPTDLPLYDRLARAHQVTGDAAGAERVLTRAVEKFPRERTLHESLARLRLERGDGAGAVLALEAMLVAIAPRDGVAWTEVATSLVERGDRAGGSRILRALVERSGGDGATSLDVEARLRAWGDHASALELALARLGRGSPDPDAHETVAAELVGAGRVDEAIGLLERLAARAGNAPALSLRLAEWLDGHGALDAAFALVQAALAGGADTSVAMAVADRYRGRGDTTRALAVYKALFARCADAAVALKLVGTLGSSGDAEAALALAREAADRFPLEAAFAFNLGNLHFARRRYDEAAEAYGRAIAADPGDRQARINRAACYRLMIPRRHALARADLAAAHALERGRVAEAAGAPAARG